MPPSPPAGTVACLSGAVEQLRRDPVGLLLPVGALLLARSAGVAAVRATADLDPVRWTALIVAMAAGGLVLTAVLRSRWIAVAARNDGLAVGAWGRPLPLLGVTLVVWPLAALAMAIALVPLGAIALWLELRGWLALGAVVFAVGAAAGTLGNVLVRSVFAHAAPEVVVGGRSAVDALLVGGSRGLSELGPLVALVVAGDLATGVGALLCGALGLPGYPLTDLAVLRRWSSASRPPVSLESSRPAEFR